MSEPTSHESDSPEKPPPKFLFREDVLPFFVTRKLLKERIGASTEELEMWVWLSDLGDEQPAGFKALHTYRGVMDSNVYSLQPVKFIGADGQPRRKALSFSVFFLKAEIDAFNPSAENRWLTHAQVMERWLASGLSEVACKNRLNARLKSGDLYPLSPFTGITDRPEDGMFRLSAIESIEQGLKPFFFFSLTALSHYCAKELCVDVDTALARLAFAAHCWLSIDAPAADNLRSRREISDFNKEVAAIKDATLRSRNPKYLVTAPIPRYRLPKVLEALSALFSNEPLTAEREIVLRLVTVYRDDYEGWLKRNEFKLPIDEDPPAPYAKPEDEKPEDW